MVKVRKKNIVRIAAFACTAAVVGLLAAMPLLAKPDEKAEGPQASILSGTVENGSVSTEVIGGGTLAEEDAETVSIPSKVKLTEYLVSNGDTVREGDPIAAVDRVTVMKAISEVQETLDHLAEEIEAASEEDTDGEVKAQAGGTVKICYAEEGDAVQDVMLEYGALATLSLDDLMAVDLISETAPDVGTTVNVTFSDGTVVSGKVETGLADELTVTVEDDDYPVGETVAVTLEDGTAIGSGVLYIYSPWNAAAYAGTVESVKISEGEAVDAGDTLLKLTDVGYSAEYKQLIRQRQTYEDLMLELFEMYQTETITAPCDGLISGLDADSLQLLTVGTAAYSVIPLANAPYGDEETLYSNFVGKVTAVGQNGLALSMDLRNIPVADYMELSGVSWDDSAMTELFVYDPVSASTPVFELVDGAWVQINAADIAAGDILLIAGDDSGNFVWIIRLQKSAEDPADPETPGTAEPDTPTEPSVPSDPSTPTQPGASDDPGTVFPSGGGSWGGSGSYPQDSVTEPEFELFSLDIAEIAVVTPQDTVTMNITINELDITSIHIGMSAEVRIDALGGEEITASVTDISNTGENSGGYSFFTVELTMDRHEDMLVGMNATAVMTTGTENAVLTVPAEALVEDGTKTILYTGYDEESGILTDPVTVTTGVSDGQTVEITGGLSAGSTFYYAYYDTLEISFAPDFNGGFGGFLFGAL
ncbi:MAG: HlyD family efflux transporter periplasmic adaptor subunit [Clostridia bacterium]|nr:HlyD family efflux transporter periplasmic adaptor subunit [Clostridia bacterium]